MQLHLVVRQNLEKLTRKELNNLAALRLD